MKRRKGTAAPAAFAVLFGLAVVEWPGCSSSASLPSGDGGSNGTGGASSSTGGASGPGTGGTGGASSGTGGAGTSGTGGVTGSWTFSCGSDTCTVGQSFCYTHYFGATGGHPDVSCQPAPDSKCVSCQCLCPATSATTCSSAVVGPHPYCSCTETNGEVNLTCGDS